MLEVIARGIILVNKLKDCVEDDILIGVVIHMILRWENVIFKVQSEFLIFLLKVRLLLLRAVLLADVIVLNFICLLVQVVDSLLDIECLFFESLIESECEERWYSLDKLSVARYQRSDSKRSERVDHSVQELQLLIDLYLIVHLFVEVDLYCSVKVFILQFTD